jgi:asparagine synthetase B (glutamine-hydrolysing)
MCGITGIVGHQINNSNNHSAIKKMNDAIAHRGPNSEGSLE